MNKLPNGNTCGDCLSAKRCFLIFSVRPESTRCDWIPIRFRPAFPDWARNASSPPPSVHAAPEIKR